MIPISLYAQDLNAPGNWSITSDFGPRNAGSEASWFHKGIDYGGTEGEVISAVEGGAIKTIDYDSGFYIGIDGDNNGYWTYLHIFSGTSDDLTESKTSGNWELMNTTVEHATSGITEQTNVIVLWSGNYAEKVLCIQNYSGYYVKDSSGTYILDSNGDKIKTKSSVIASESIAPVGTSGGYPAHLHLGNRIAKSALEKDNPLLYVSHTASDFKATILSPRGSISKLQADTGAIPIMGRINSTAGLDLNTVAIFVDGTEESNKIATFNLGGKSDESATTNASTSSGETVSGVIYKVSPYNTTTGYDDFIIDSYDFSPLEKGAHLIYVRATDINDNEKTFAFNLNIVDYEIKGSKINSILTPPYQVSEEYPYPNTEWGQVFTGTQLHTGYAAKEESVPMISLILDISYPSMPVNEISSVRFKDFSTGGGTGYEYMGGDYPAGEDETSSRALLMDVYFYDSNNTLLGYTQKEIYDYEKDEYIAVYEFESNIFEGHEIGTYEFKEIKSNPNYSPTDGVKIEELELCDLKNDAGLGASNAIKYVSFDFRAMVTNMSLYGFNDNSSSSDRVWLEMNIEGIPWNATQSATQKIYSITAPDAITNERQPTITGCITSSGGNITGIWGRYASATKSAWTMATPTDGAFDSSVESFTYTVSGELEDGDHLIEIKVLNEQGEQDAIYYTVYFTVENSPAISTGTSSNLGGVIAYPNPYKPGSGTIYDRAGGIVFANLTQTARIKIFNIAGELIFEGIEDNGDGNFEWGAINNSFEKVASGVYIYFIVNQDNSSDKIIGKIGVIK